MYFSRPLIMLMYSYIQMSSLAPAPSSRTVDCLWRRAIWLTMELSDPPTRNSLARSSPQKQSIASCRRYLWIEAIR